MRAVTGMWTAAASNSIKKGLLTSETVLRCEVRLTYSPKATYRTTSCLGATRLIIGIIKT